MKGFYSNIIGFIFCIVAASAQQLPIDFSEANQSFIAFGNSNFSININPDDSNDEVGQFFNDGSDPWQGFYLDMTSAIDLSEAQQLTLNFYQFDPQNHSITLKLESGTEADVEVTVANSGSGWTDDIIFDFSNATISGTSNNIDATGSYSRLTIFIDGGSTQTGTYLIDDINNGSEPVDPHELDIIYTDLVWSDEFDSTTPEAVDASKWYHQTFGPNGGQWFNGEEQHYTDRLDNSFIENGFLNIVAKSEELTQDGVTLNYTSARLNSKFAFTYGRVDVRAKLPAGDGTWPAIWTLGKNINETDAYWQTQGFGTTSWPACGEIDIMEHGLHATNEVSSALHSPSSFGNTVNTETQVLTDVANDFHVYSVNWSPNQITFLIDGIGYYTYNPDVKDANTWPFDNDHYLLLNVAMGGFAGTINPSFSQSNMVIDYVRVYQNASLGLDEVTRPGFNVYPNPAKNIIHIKTELTIESIELFNTLGQNVLDLNRQVEQSQLDVSGIKSGIYFIKIQTEIGTFQKRILIE